MAENEQPYRVLYIAIDQEIVAEFIRRSNPNVDIESYVNSQMWDFLDRTEGDTGFWENEKYLEEFEKEELNQEILKEFGSPKTGYRWGPVFMPNGTEIRMIYKKKEFNARVKHEKIYTLGSRFDLVRGKNKFVDFYSDDSPCSPSELVKRITRTNRNAWRDLWIKGLGDSRWVLADDLRKRFAHTR